MIIDTHAHIYVPAFQNDRDKIIKQAEKEGVTRILLPAIDASTHAEMLQTEADYPTTCFSMMGVHPCSIKESYKEELKVAAGYLEKRAFLAVGEIGLDFHWDTSFAEQQYAAFHEQIEWALHYKLPIVIHSRNATDECIKVVAAHQQGNLKGVFHCFSGTAAQAKQIKALGFYLGVGGVVTFKNGGLDAVLEKEGLENVVLETDAPYLAPVPFRGKRNEPSYLRYITAKLASVLQTEPEQVEAITTKNAELLFSL